MMKRSVVYIDHDRLGTKGKDRILRGYRLDEDEIALAPDLDLVDVLKPLLGEQDPLVSHFRAHVGRRVKRKNSYHHYIENGGWAAKRPNPLDQFGPYAPLVAAERITG